MADFITSNKSFSGCDIVASIDILDSSNIRKSHILGSLLTLTYSTFQDKKPVRSLGNINAKDYVYGPRTIAGTMIFAVFNKHIIYEISGGNETSLMDELPPFDISISYANEYGIQSRMAIYGVRIVSEGQTVSVNDIYTENTYQYVAQDIEYINDTTKNTLKKSKGNSKIITSVSDTVTAATPASKLVELIDKNNVLNTSSSKKATVVLSCKAVDALSLKKLGIAKLTLNPSQKDGITTITGTNGTINVDNSEFPNSTLYIPLQCGDYTAIYENANSGLKSNEVSFNIGYKEVDNVSTAPLIIQRTDSSIKVMINNLHHDTLKYGVVVNGADIVYSSKNINSRTATITNLVPDTTYSIYSCNKDDTSYKVTVKTLKTKTVLFDLIEDTINSNAVKLKYPKGDYLAVISYAKQIYLDNESKSQAFSVSDSLMSIRQKAVLDYNVTEDTNLKANYLKIMNICSNLTDIVLNISNNENYYSNKYSEIKLPKQLEQTDLLLNGFSISDNIRKINIYDPLNKMSLVKTINTADQNTLSIANLKNGKYSALCIDKNNRYSPISEFYILDSNEKTDYYNNVVPLISKYNTDAEYYKQKLEMESGEFDALNTDAQSRILFESVNNPLVALFKAPEVTDCSQNGITVSIDTSDVFFGSSKYYLVLCELNGVITNTINFKKEIIQNTNEIVFEDSLYGIKDNTTYCVWIENEDGEQVSTAVTTRIDDSDKSIIDSIVVRDYMAYAEILLKSVSDYDNKTNEIITSLYIDETVSKYNIYDKLIEKILSYGATLPNKNEYLLAVLKSKYSVTSSNFFLSSLLYKKGQYIVLPKGENSYIANVNSVSYYSDQVNTISTSVTCNEDTTINLNDYGGDCIYIVCRCQESSMYSGVVLINMQNSDISYFGLNIQEVK